MFQFSFSVSKTISRNTSSYPIILSQVKARSEYFRLNPADNSFDSYIESIIIPKVIYDWENLTKYLLLDRTMQSFVPNLKSIRTEQINILLPYLNIREFTNVKYYPESWDYSAAKTTVDGSYYFFVPEAKNQPHKLNIKEKYLPFELFAMENNLEINYKGGFEDNDFNDLNESIVDALACQAAMIIDSRNGLCQDFFSDIIKEVYADYSINKQEIVVL